MSGKPIRNRIMKYFEEHPGINIYSQDLASELNETQQRVMGCMNHLIAKRGAYLPGLERIGYGGPWIYRPNSSLKGADKIVYEYVVTTKSGAIIL